MDVAGRGDGGGHRWQGDTARHIGKEAVEAGRSYARHELVQPVVMAWAVGDGTREAGELSEHIDQRAGVVLDDLKQRMQRCLGQDGPCPQTDRRHLMGRVIPPHFEAQIEARKLERHVDRLAVSHRQARHPGVFAARIMGCPVVDRNTCDGSMHRNPRSAISSWLAVSQTRSSCRSASACSTASMTAPSRAPSADMPFPWHTDSAREFGRVAAKTGTPITSSPVRSPTRVTPSDGRYGSIAASDFGQFGACNGLRLSTRGRSHDFRTQPAHFCEQFAVPMPCRDRSRDHFLSVAPGIGGKRGARLQCGLDERLDRQEAVSERHPILVVHLRHETEFRVRDDLAGRQQVLDGKLRRRVQIRPAGPIGLADETVDRRCHESTALSGGDLLWAAAYASISAFGTSAARSGLSMTSSTPSSLSPIT